MMRVILLFFVVKVAVKMCKTGVMKTCNSEEKRVE